MSERREHVEPCILSKPHWITDVDNCTCPSAPHSEDRIEEAARETLTELVVRTDRVGTYVDEEASLKGIIPVLRMLYDDGKKAGAEERLIDGVAAVMYVTDKPGFWWHLVREEVREKWRASARAAIAAGEIYGK